MTASSVARLLILSAIWGGSFIFMRIAVPALGPATLMLLRVVLAALFLAGRYDEASQAFRDALVQSPQNGWALYGLMRSEQALGHALEAAAARKAFTKAWVGERRWLRMDRL